MNGASMSHALPNQHVLPTLLQNILTFNHLCHIELVSMGKRQNQLASKAMLLETLLFLFFIFWIEKESLLKEEEKNTKEEDKKSTEGKRKAERNKRT